MVAKQPNHLQPSHHLYSHCACAHILWVFWDPVAANQLLAFQLTSNMTIQPCCLITGSIRHKTAWWLNSQTTYFHHTASIATVHVQIASWCSGTLSQQKPAPCLATNQPFVNPTMLFDPRHHVTLCSMVVEQSNHLLPSYHLHNHCACCI
jgi:hypothetical protein